MKRAGQLAISHKTLTDVASATPEVLADLQRALPARSNDKKIIAAFTQALGALAALEAALPSAPGAPSSTALGQAPAVACEAVVPYTAPVAVAHVHIEPPETDHPLPPLPCLPVPAWWSKRAQPSIAAGWRLLQQFLVSVCLVASLLLVAWVAYRPQLLVMIAARMLQFVPRYLDYAFSQMTTQLFVEAERALMPPAPAPAPHPQLLVETPAPAAPPALQSGYWLTGMTMAVIAVLSKGSGGAVGTASP